MSCVNDVVGPYGIRQFGQAVHRELTTGKTSIDLAETCAPVRQSAAAPGIWNPLPLFGDVQRDHQAIASRLGTRSVDRRSTQAVPLMAGGGVKKGFLYGKTADERPCTTIENPVPVEDLHATMYHALGIAPDQYFLNERRPVYVTKDGKGKVINELFA